MSDTYARTHAQAGQAHYSSKGAKAAPRLYHRKSRTGCQRCRARRVKCNEVHPVCGSCRQHQIPCVYEHHSPHRAAERLEPNGAGNAYVTSRTNPGKWESSPNITDLPESRKRRLLELKLLHRYTTKTSLFHDPTESTGTDVWSIIVPNLAFEHEALLYSMYSLSALHLAKAEPHDPEAIDAYRRYLDLALREHSNDVTHLSKNNADVVCLTSSLLRTCGFAILQERQLDPYRPPMQWLQMTSGTGNIFRAVWGWIKDDETSIARRLIRRMPVSPDEKVLFKESNREGFLHLLRRSRIEDATEPWHPDIQEAYMTTISYIGSVQIAINAQERPADINRRLTLFPILIQKRFIDLVEEQQPRALVLLAHYFALLAKFRDLWWVGDTGQKEIRAIQSVLPEEWQDLMSWPLRAMEERFVLV